MPGLVLGAYAWRVADAIGDAQDAAVVPLPTRDPARSAAARRSTPTPAGAAATDDRPTATATATPPSDGTSIDAPPPPTATAEPTASTEPSPTPPTPAGSDASSAETVRASAGGPGSGDDPSNANSSLSILSQVLEAGTDRGDPGADPVWAGRTALNILVLGVDRRPDGGDQNADVIILARLDLRSKALTAVSIPRDLLVTIPGHGDDKINAAYNLGVRADPADPAAGVALVRDTVEVTFGVPIDHYVLADFAGFEAVIDAVGGVDITVPAPIRDEAYPTEDFGTEVVEFRAGRQHMDGETALKYARTRNADSDDQRRERQIQVLLALFDEGKSLGSVRRAAEIVLALGNAVQTSFRFEEQLTLVRLGLATDRSALDLQPLPAELLQSGYTAEGAWVYTGDAVVLRDFVLTQLGIPAEEVLS